MNYFFSLWGRNMKGIITRSFSESVYALFIPLHILTVFLSVPLAGLIKTIFDVSSRSYTDEKDMPSVIESIQNIDDTEMGRLIHHLNNPRVKYQSNSSAEIIEHISTDANKQTEKEQIENLKTKWLDESADHPIQYVTYPIKDEDTTDDRAFGMNFLPPARERLDIVNTTSYTQKQKEDLRAAKKNQLDRDDTLYVHNLKGGISDSVIFYKLPHPVKVGFEKSKKQMLDYMNNDANNGKQLFQRIVNFFSNPPREVDPQLNVSVQSKCPTSTSRTK